MYPNLTTPAFYQVDSQPAVILSDRAFPKLWKPHLKTWETQHDLPTFFERAERINQTEFNRLAGNLPEPKLQGAPKPAA